jgi:uncharacterized protein
MPFPAQTTWVIHDGAAGNRRQALALAEALGGPVREWSLSTTAPARWFAPRRLPGSGGAFGPAFTAAMNDSPPGLAIGCGRQAALATRALRERGSRVVQILDPRIDPRHWDLVVAPSHDRLTAANIVTLDGSLHPVDDAWLAQARVAFAALGALPGPRTAVLLGGPTAATKFDRSAFEVMMTKLEATLAAQGGCLLLCGSPRTLPEVAALARQRYGADPGLVWFDDSDGPNPYAGVLAWADRFVVSPDSVNLVSEACATTAPVFVAEPGRATGRVRRFLATLEARGRLRAQDRDLAQFAATPLRETARVADEVRRRLIPR